MMVARFLLAAVLLLLTASCHRGCYCEEDCCYDHRGGHIERIPYSDEDCHYRDYYQSRPVP